MTNNYIIQSVLELAGVVLLAVAMFNDEKISNIEKTLLKKYREVIRRK